MSPRQPSQPVDLLDLQGDDYGAFTSAPLVPDHIHLPPRPSEISPDYVPPLRSPRRLSSFSFPGPSSPPQLSEIVFDPLENAGPPRNFGTAQSKLFNTLATTTKLASKWKTVLDPNLYNTPDRHPPSATALPIDVNHASPFAYTHASPSRTTASSAPHPRSTLEWSGTVLSGRRSATSSVLTSSIADQLRQHLPPRQRLSTNWSLLFSLDQHGASLSTLYRLVEQQVAVSPNAGNILVVTDGQGSIFGAYVNEHLLKKEGQYYGGGESFLYKVLANDLVKPFRWTGKNQYFALCESGMISFGGGSGSYGLILDSTFSHNSTASCPTFDNEVLNESQPVYSSIAIPFVCLGLEVWSTR